MFIQINTEDGEINKEGNLIEILNGKKIEITINNTIYKIKNVNDKLTINKNDLSEKCHDRIKVKLQCQNQIEIK